jgi:excisionase family DNA binding protein
LAALTSATVTVEEAAELLGISRTEAYGWLQASSPILPHQRRGSRYVIFRADVEALAQRGLAATHADHSAPNGHGTSEARRLSATPDWSQLLAELLGGRDLEFAIETPIGRIGGTLKLGKGREGGTS